MFLDPLCVCVGEGVKRKFFRYSKYCHEGNNRSSSGQKSTKWVTNSLHSGWCSPLEYTAFLFLYCISLKRTNCLHKSSFLQSEVKQQLTILRKNENENCNRFIIYAYHTEVPSKLSFPVLVWFVQNWGDSIRPFLCLILCSILDIFAKLSHVERNYSWQLFFQEII